MEMVAIFGAAGPIGRVVGRELRLRDVRFRVVGRRRATLDEAFGDIKLAEICAADLSDPRAAAEAARGVDTILYTVGVPYNAFQLHPKLMQVTVDAAAAAGVRSLLVVSSVYSYGVPQTRTVAETHPRNPQTFKGRMRKEQEDIALAAHREGRLQSLVVHLPDFYGPWADNSLGNMILRAALAGKPANWLGSPDKAHEFVYVPDAAPVLVEMASRSDCYGEHWNFAGPAEVTGAEFMTLVYRQLELQPKWRAVGRTMLRIAGWFNPLMRELVEMHYLFETPVILDDSKLKRKLGAVNKTAYQEGISKALAWMRAHPAEKSRA
jgi:nucleoside-diphosphate-sugar epimerase